MLSVGSLKKAQKALFWSLPLMVLFNIFCYWDGVVIYANYRDCDPMQDPDTKVTAADQLMPYAILKMFGRTPGLPGLCIAGIFSASLSSISSAINSLTAVTMEDFIRPYCVCKRLTESWAAFMAKIIVIGYGGLCLLLVIIVANFRGVLEAASVMFGMVAGPILGVYTLGLFTTRANESGTLIGLLVGFVINAWLGFGSYAAKVPIPTLSRSTDGCHLADNITLHFSSAGQNDTALSSDTGLENVLSGIHEERYVLPVHKISFVWFSVIGCTLVIIVGYVASFIIGIWTDQRKVSEEYISPFVRKLHFKSFKRSPRKEKIYSEVPMTRNEKKDVETYHKNGH